MELLAWAPPFSTFSIGTGQRVGVRPADGAVERDLQVVRHGLGARQRDGQHRVGAEPALVRCAVEIDHGVVDGPLVERVEPADGIRDLAVDVAPRRAARPCPRSGRRRRAARPPRGCRSRRRTARWPGRGHRSRAAPRPRRSGCRGSREPRARSRAQWCSRRLSLGVAPGGTPGHKVSGCPPGVRGRLRPRGCPSRSDRARSRSACSASTPRRWARLATAKRSSPNARWRSARVARQRVVGAADRCPRHGGSAPPACPRVSPAVTSSGSRPTARALRASLVASISAGSAGGDALGDAAAALLALLDRLPVGDDLVRAVGVDVAEDVGVAVDELVVDAARHVGQVEVPGLVGEPGVEDDLEEQVAQLLLAGGRRRPRRPPGPSTSASASSTS